MKFPKTIRTCLFALLFGGLSSSASGGLIASIAGLDIGGTSYDVTFHSGPSFNQLWDADGNGVFGDDTSTFNAAPVFWNDAVGADMARTALIAYFPDDGANGTVQGCAGGSFCDGFLIPLAHLGVPPTDLIAYSDISINPDQDGVSFFQLQANRPISHLLPWATFALSAKNIPEPLTFSIFALGLAAVSWSRHKFSD